MKKILNYFSEYKFQLIIVLVTLAFLSTLVHQQNGEIEIKKLTYQVDSLTKLSDSLQSDLFQQSTVIGRYEITLDYMKVENPKAAEQFELFLYTQTE